MKRVIGMIADPVFHTRDCVLTSKVRNSKDLIPQASILVGEALVEGHIPETMIVMQSPTKKEDVMI